MVAIGTFSDGLIRNIPWAASLEDKLEKKDTGHQRTLRALACALKKRIPILLRAFSHSEGWPDVEGSLTAGLAC